MADGTTAGVGTTGAPAAGAPVGGAVPLVGEPAPDVDAERRELLRAGWRAGQLLLAGAAGWTTLDALRPLPDAGGAALLDAGAVDGFADGTATFVRAGRLYVVNVGGALLALSQKCAHLGCRVPFCEATRRFECPCHGSMYDLGGEWLAGPAPRGLDRFPVQVVDGRVLIDTRTVEEGPPIGAARFRGTVRDAPGCGAAHG